MTRVVSRLLISLLMIPAGLIGVIVSGEIITSSTPWDDDKVYPALFVLASVGYCIIFRLLWGALVRWTPERRRRTWILSGLAVVAAVLGSSYWLTSDNHYYMSSQFLAMTVCVVALLWSIAAAWIWTETSRERAERLRTAGYGSRLCPGCKYDMSGLTNLTCPECGLCLTVERFFEEQRTAANPPSLDA